jgi:hypothetical protein
MLLTPVPTTVTVSNDSSESAGPVAAAAWAAGMLQARSIAPANREYSAERKVIS